MEELVQLAFNRLLQLGRCLVILKGFSLVLHYLLDLAAVSVLKLGHVNLGPVAAIEQTYHVRGLNRLLLGARYDCIPTAAELTLDVDLAPQAVLAGAEGQFPHVKLSKAVLVLLQPKQAEEQRLKGFIIGELLSLEKSPVPLAELQKDANL